MALHPAPSVYLRGIPISNGSKSSASSVFPLGAFRVSAANIVFSVAYSLFGALASLFYAPLLCFQALAASFAKILGVGVPLTERSISIYQRARMRYFRTEVPFLSTGTLNWAAKAAVLVNLYVDESISQSPPIGSLTSTVIGVSL